MKKPNSEDSDSHSFLCIDRLLGYVLSEYSVTDLSHKSLSTDHKFRTGASCIRYGSWNRPAPYRSNSGQRNEVTRPSPSRSL